MVTIHYLGDRAWCEFNGQRLEARSKSGAIHALCRKLAALPGGDTPWQGFCADRPRGTPTCYGASVALTSRYIVEEGDAGMSVRKFKPWTGGIA